jgi:hypothetical protein
MATTKRTKTRINFKNNKRRRSKATVAAAFGHAQRICAQPNAKVSLSLAGSFNPIGARSANHEAKDVFESISSLQNRIIAASA